MKTLYDLARLNSKSNKLIEALIPPEEASPLKKLASLVIKGSGLDDEGAMKEIYGKRNYAAFFRLKSRMKDILIHSTLLQNTNFEVDDNRLNESFNELRYAIAIRILHEKKANYLSVELAEKSIVKCMKHHLTENVIVLARLLVRHYATREYNKYKLKKYLEIQQKYLRIQENELKAENYFLDLQRTQLESLADANDSIKNKAARYVEELESIKDVQTLNFYINKYKVQAAYYEYQKEFDSLLDLSEKVLVDFAKHKWKSNTFTLSVNLRKAWSLIQAGRNIEAASMGLKELHKFPIGTLSWYFLAHYILKAYLYNGEYRKAVFLIKEMIETPKFSKISENYRELFLTTLGYLHLVVESNLFEETKDLKTELPEFKLYKFLNTSPVFSKDKRGINVSILLMHISFLLIRKDFSGIIDKVDSLHQYSYRYLRKDDSFRSNCIIKMVIQMTRADFNPIRTERYTVDLLKQLNQVHLAGSGENIENEIIPYEILWKIMIGSIRV